MSGIIPLQLLAYIEREQLALAGRTQTMRRDDLAFELRRLAELTAQVNSVLRAEQDMRAEARMRAGQPSSGVIVRRFPVIAALAARMRGIS